MNRVKASHIRAGRMISAWVGNQFRVITHEEALDLIEKGKLEVFEDELEFRKRDFADRDWDIILNKFGVADPNVICVHAQVDQITTFSVFDDDNRR